MLPRLSEVARRESACGGGQERACGASPRTLRPNGSDRERDRERERTLRELVRRVAGARVREVARGGGAHARRPKRPQSEHMVQARALGPAGEGEKDRKSMSGACACKRCACGASARALGPVGERERMLVLRVAGARACVVAAICPLRECTRKTAQRARVVAARSAHAVRARVHLGPTGERERDTERERL